MLNFLRTTLLLAFGLLMNQALRAQTKSKVEILGANNFEYIKTGAIQISKLIGNVKMKQQNTLMYCDSALLYETENKVEAFSNVRINHNDSVTITGNYLLYDGNTRKALITGDVQMVDKSMTLTTQQLDYDLNNQLGYYTSGGTIISTDNKLTSEIGYYYSRQKEFFFKRNVVLVNPEYTIKSDTLMYNTFTKIAYFFGSTNIKGKSEEIFCENGWYNTVKDLSQFSRNAVLFTDKTMLMADSLFYDRKARLGKAFRNIHIYDSAQKIHLYGNYGQSNGKTNISYVNKKSYAIKLMGKQDSLFLYADTLLLLQKEKNQKQMLKAFHEVKLFKPDLQAVCDSLVYMSDDSSMRLYHKPVIWSGKNQVSADTIVFYINNGKLDSFNFLNDAFLISKEKGAHYNQIKGKNMFGNMDSTSIKIMYVYGNAQSIHYEKEDSLRYIGINKIDCSEMVFSFSRGQMEKAVFIKDAEATMYTLDELKPEELRLNGFKWQEKRRPQKLYFQ